ncbi:signal protein [Streptomyces lanatus]|uniref:Signal protein n=1 Tax=Streptomyces lanatus TaxID=66900 RepID=A0ABV1XQS8_9ACTN|nr:signal protein [Streptomyces lanatus]GHH06093.1 hypothetical protein GCM10018780_38530 [Streptomyces lanatus]
MKIKTGRTGLIAVALVALVGCGAGASAESEGATETEQTSAPASAAQSPTQVRLSSEVLQSRWWTWASSEPEGTNPVADEDGSECARNQPQDVWFLAGTFGTQAKRTCSVPDGVPVAFPLVNLIGSPADCTDFMSAAKGSAVLDGKPVDSETVRGETITVRGVADNPLTGTDGRVSATGCGLWVQLSPLRPGKHTLTIRGQSEDFAVGVEYSLTVGGA